ncbi:MAG: ATP-binding protein [Acidimicrobiales bacterium]|nr:ATP-binding protein [Acidimicrobiales bacterium]
MEVRTSRWFRRERSAVPSARAFVAHALRSAGAPGQVVDALVLAVAEACNNAVLHAGGTAVTLTVSVEDGRATVTIADDGVGFDPPRHPTMPAPLALGHRGLALMDALVDRVDVSSGAAGTTVALVQSLGAGVPPAGVVADA